MFSFHGGLLWIDWINTQYMHQGEIHDGVHDLPSILDWFAAAEALHADRRWQALAAATDEQKGSLVSDLFILRTELRGMAEEIAESCRIPESAIANLNERLARTAGIWQIIASGEEPSAAHGAHFLPQGDLSQQWQWPLLQSAMEFLATGNLSRLKACGNHQCIQYYYDTSKNNTRRWCRMETCGNREKARRHYHKKNEKSS